MHDERLRTMKYISPSGSEFTLNFDSLSRTGGKKAPVSEYPGQNQAGVQDLGELTPTFPIPCYITGADYDQEADRFWNALAETGPGKLIHPRWGNLKVLAINRVQTEEFVEGVGRAVFEITFIRASEGAFEFPHISTDYAGAVTANVEAATEAITESVPEEITDVGLLAGAKENITAALDIISEGLDSITGLTDDVRQGITQTVADIESEIDDLVESPANLMSSLLTLYRLPATVKIDIGAKIEGYAIIYSGLVTGAIDTTKKYGEIFGAVAAAIFGANAIAAAESATAGDITTRDAAGQIVEDLNSLYSSIKDGIQDLEDAGIFSTAYDMEQSLELTMSAAIAGLIDKALNLPAERKMILDREVPPDVLYYELVGNLDELDAWMKYNRFTDDEILLIPRGREVRWYVG